MVAMSGSGIGPLYSRPYCFWAPPFCHQNSWTSGAWARAIMVARVFLGSGSMCVLHFTQRSQACALWKSHIRPFIWNNSIYVIIWIKTDESCIEKQTEALIIFIRAACLFIINCVFVCVCACVQTMASLEFDLYRLLGTNVFYECHSKYPLLTYKCQCYDLI